MNSLKNRKALLLGIKLVIKGSLKNRFESTYSKNHLSSSNPSTNQG